MTNFERNESSLITKKIDEEINEARIGQVEQVYEHNAANDDSNFEVDVSLDANTLKEPRCPVLASGSGEISVPKKGDKVLLIYTEGGISKPVAFGISWSNKDRAPLGLAGLYKNSFESGESPSGKGDLHINGYTSYNESPASTDKRELEAEESMIQIAKHDPENNVDPSDPQNPKLPAMVELYDSPKDDKSWIKVEMNKVAGEDSDVPWGMKFNIKTGEWRVVGPSGHGITCDKDGNFSWHYKKIDYIEESSGGSLSL